MNAPLPADLQLALDYAPPRASRKTRKTFSLRFKRAVQFPRFGMESGEVWDCDAIGRTGREYANAVATGADRFPFAGGLCLLGDVEVLT